MDIKQEISKYANMVPGETLLHALERPLRLAGEPPLAILPSMEVRPDGPALTSLFVVTETYLCEVRLYERAENFDFVKVRSIGNYRIRLFVQSPNMKESSKPPAPTPDSEASPPDGPPPVRYEVASVQFLHTGVGGGLEGFRSKLTYVGSDREAWIEAVLRAIPLSILKES